MKQYITSLTLLLAILLSNLSAQAKQHEVVLKVMEQSKRCGQNYYAQPEEIKALSWSDLACAQSLKLVSKTTNPTSTKNFCQARRDLNALPVNNCVFRGNRNYARPENLSFLKALQVSMLVNTDAMSHLANPRTSLKYFYLPMSAGNYPKGDSLEAIVYALSYMADATPSKRTYISCFYGKHRTGLIVALYQFLGEYSKDPVQTCAVAGLDGDRAYGQALLLGKGGLTYDMPTDFRKFYRDFTGAVCKNQSAEFLKF